MRQRSLKTGTRFGTNKNSRRKARLGIQHRRLLCELLEDRRMLSTGAAPELPGLHLVDPNLDNLRDQIIYLDFDGAKGVTYRGPVTVGPFDVPAFRALDTLAGQEDEIICTTVGWLNAVFAEMHVTFIASPPASATGYSTIYVGGTGERFAPYGPMDGVAEAVDIGNGNRSDLGFVFSELIERPGISACEYHSMLTSVVSHESAHLLGFAHQADEMLPGEPQADPSVLSDFAHKVGVSLDLVQPILAIGTEVHQWITKEAYDLYVSQFQFPNTEPEHDGFGELGRYLTGSRYQPDDSFGELALASHVYDYDNNIIEGSRDQDLNLENPIVIFDSPSFRHFAKGGDIDNGDDELRDGYIAYSSAFEWAEFFWYGWRQANYTDDYDTNRPGAPDLYNNGYKGLAYWYIGHVAHLLQDMTVPAHVHNDGHLPGNDDEYEEWLARIRDPETETRNFETFNSTGALPTWSDSIPVSLESLFRQTADYTDDYDSDGEEGDSRPEFSFGDQYNTPERHKPGEVENDWNGTNWDLTKKECQTVGNDLMFWAMEQTANLFRLFYHEVDKTPPDVTVYDLSSSESSPTVVSGTFDVRGKATDVVSGVDWDGYHFYTELDSVSGWTQKKDWDACNSTDRLALTTPGVYRIWLEVENGAGDIGKSSYKYVRVIPATGRTLAIGDVDTFEGGNGTKNVTFTVTLSQASTQDVTVQYTTADGTASLSDNDYTAASSTLRIPAGQTTATMAVQIKGDTKDELDEYFYVNLSNANGATIADDQGLGTIRNDEGFTTIRINDVTHTEGSSGQRPMSLRSAYITRSRKR